ncbi:restriction endonuclease subunit S [Flavobacterium covae]|uniref:restriction endonuclease subunit S n=1 Tax=Flavobacterium covae TaxID=2906076 RepID=UPI001FB78042|nr:restriction endonuclease subunit S [Flavobacterium covae]MCJ1807326.1 restriction endonuclease subunit S [Flavobacterium covae]
MSNNSRQYFREDSFFDVPKDGDIIALKFICNDFSKYGANLSAENYSTDGSRFIRTSDIDEDGKLSVDGVYIDEDLALEYKLKKGDFLLSRSGTLGRGYLYNELDGNCSYAGYLIKYSLNELIVNPKFIFYCTKTSQFNGWLNYSVIEATIGNINGEKYANLPLPIPSIEQQNKIVHYLDREIAKIDALIEKKTKLIALLEEKKKAVINQAVTKGLDTSVAMKDSGIEWLGEIPEHWEVNKISRVFDSIGSGTTPTSSNLEYYQDGNHSWLITSDLNDSYIFETSKKITDAAVYDFSALKLFPSNSLVIAMYGATIGKTGLTKIECYTNQACCVISNSTKVHIRYAHFYFIAMKQNLVNLSNGGGQPNISQGIIRDFKIVYPNLIEQEKIINFLENKIEETDLTIQKIIKTINLLKEKRTAIISAAINGEIEL